MAMTMIMTFAILLTATVFVPSAAEVKKKGRFFCVANLNVRDD